MVDCCVGSISISVLCKNIESGFFLRCMVLKMIFVGDLCGRSWQESLLGGTFLGVLGGGGDFNIKRFPSV